MTGKRLSDFQRQILVKLVQISKLNNHDIAFILDFDERTIRRRRYEYAATGSLAPAPNVSKNAEKLKPQYLEVCAACRLSVSAARSLLADRWLLTPLCGIPEADGVACRA